MYKRDLTAWTLNIQPGALKVACKKKKNNLYLTSSLTMSSTGYMEPVVDAPSAQPAEGEEVATVVSEQSESDVASSDFGSESEEAVSYTHLTLPTNTETC